MLQHARVGFRVLIALMFFPALASAQQDPPATYGTASPTILTKAAFDFEHIIGAGTDGGVNPSSLGRICGSGTCGWLTGLNLPNGALIHGFDFSGCDFSAAGQLQFTILRSPRGGGATPILAPFQSTGTAATPGCGVFSFDLVTPVTVDNFSNAYLMQVLASTGVEWTQFRVRYFLQVSPAPGTASFADVPVGDPLHRFVEALVAAGITAGCGGGNYCPNAPITRGQMAVFLSAALGLHWPF